MDNKPNSKEEAWKQEWKNKFAKAKTINEEKDTIENESSTGGEASKSKSIIPSEKDFNNKSQRSNSYLETLKEIYIHRLKDGYEEIKRTIADEINRMSWEQIANSNYLDVRIKQLVGDLIEHEQEEFIKAVQRANKEFSYNIDTYVLTYSLKVLSTPSDMLKPSDKDTIDTLVSTGALTATVGTAPATAALLHFGAATLVGGIPIVGGIVASIATVLGLAVGTGYVIFNFPTLYGGFKKLMSKAVNASAKQKEQMAKEALINTIHEYLDKQLDQIITNIKNANLT